MAQKPTGKGKPAKGPKPPSAPPEKKGGLVQWLRGTGFVSLLLGGATLVLSIYFWVAVWIIYFGFAILAADLYFEITLSHKEKVIAAAVLVGFIAAFSWGIAFRPAPISITTMGPARNFSAGSNVGGIIWKDAFADVRIDISNPTLADYDNFTADIQTDQPIAKITQRSSIPNCFFQLKNETQAIIDAGSGVTTLKEPDLVVLATNQPWVLHCAKLPAGTTVEVEVATATVDLEKNLMERRLWNLPTGGATLQLKIGPLGRVWMGDPDYNDYLPGPDPVKIRVISQYTATFQVHAWQTILNLHPKGD